MGSFCCTLTSVWANFKAICFGRAPCAGCLWCRVFKDKYENEINVSPSWLSTRLEGKRIAQMAHQNKWLFLVWKAGSWETRGATHPNDRWQPRESLEMKTYGFSLLKTCLKFIDARLLTQLPHLANRQASNSPTSRSPLNKFPFITRTKPERLKQSRQLILVTEKLEVFLGDQKGDEDESVLRELWRSFWRCLWPRAQPSWSYLTMCFSCLASSRLPNPQTSSLPRTASSRNSAQVNHQHLQPFLSPTLSLFHPSLSLPFTVRWVPKGNGEDGMSVIRVKYQSPPRSLCLSPKADLSSWVFRIYSSGLCVQANPSSENRAKGRTRTHKPDRGRRGLFHMPLWILRLDFLWGDPQG